MSKLNFNQLRLSIVEKTLTRAELKKREEVAKAIEREHPGMKKSMKMAIATSTAKRVAEDAVSDYMAKGGKVTTAPYKKPRKSEKTDYSSKHIGGKGEHKSGKAANTTSPKPVGEEVDQIDELKLSTVMSYANKRAAQVSDAPSPPFVNKVSKRISKNAAAGIMGALQRRAGIKPTSEEIEISEKYYGHDSMGNSLKPGSDEGEPSSRRTYPKKPVHNPSKIYHKVPFHKKDEAKKEGMKWDTDKKKWYHISPMLSSSSKFQKEEVEINLDDFTDEELETFLATEGTQLDELSYEKLNAYMKGRRKQISKSIGAGTTVGTNTPASKKLEKHVAGYRKAWAKRDMKEATIPAGSAFDPNYKSQAPKKPGETAGFDSKKTPTGTVYKRKLAKEDIEQVDELKKATVASYVDKVVDPVYGMPRSTKKLKQRLAGLQRAHARAVGKKATSEETVEEQEKVQMHKPGWMIRADPTLAAKFKDIEARRKRMKVNMTKYGGKTSAEIEQMSKK